MSARDPSGGVSRKALSLARFHRVDTVTDNRTGLIGFDMVQQQLDVTNPFAVSLLQALVKAADAHDQRVLVFTHDADRHDDFRTTAGSGLVDGFILSDSTVGDPRVDTLDQMGIPFVVLGRTTDDATHTWIDVDNHGAMRAPIDLLVSLGCRDFAFVTYNGGEHWNKERKRGTRDALAAHGLRLPRQRILTGPSLASIRPRLTALLSGPDRPDAVVTSSDSIAVLATGIATSLGLSVGPDLAVTGFDGGPLCTMISPEITSVAIPVDRIAQQLVTLLASRIAGGPHVPGQLLDAELVIRESSGFAARSAVEEAR